MTSYNKKRADSYPLAYVTANISGDKIKPEYWNGYFGVPPTRCVEKGKYFTTPSGKQSSSPGWTNIWSYSTKGVITDDSLSSHLEYLVTKLQLPRLDLKDLIEADKLKFQVSCYWMESAPERIPVIDSVYRNAIEVSGGNVSVDSYNTSKTA